MFVFNKNVSHIDILKIDFFKNILLKNNDLKSIINEYCKLQNNDFLNKLILLIKIQKILKNDIYKQKIQKRINYLRCIILLYKNGIILKNNSSIYNEKLVNDYFFEELHEKQINLKNGVYTNSENTYKFGNFFLEIIDPSHRVLNKYKLKWENNKIEEDFFAYLENFSNIENEVIINFFNKRELFSKKVCIVDGKLAYNFDNNISLINTDNNRKFLFTIDTSYNMYCYYETENYYHISSTKGKPVLAAGDIKVKDGILSALNIDTGHYLIKDTSIEYILTIFDKLKIFTSKDLPILYFTENNLQFTQELNNFLKK